MGDLVQLNRRESWPELAAYLRELAERAERGEVSAFAFATEDHLGAMSFRAFHGTGSYPIKLVGQLEVLKLAIIQRHVNPPDGEP